MTLPPSSPVHPISNPILCLATFSLGYLFHSDSYISGLREVFFPPSWRLPPPPRARRFHEFVTNVACEPDCMIFVGNFLRGRRRHRGVCFFLFLSLFWMDGDCTVYKVRSTEYGLGKREG